MLFKDRYDFVRSAEILFYILAAAAASEIAEFTVFYIVIQNLVKL